MKINSDFIKGAIGMVLVIVVFLAGIGVGQYAAWQQVDEMLCFNGEHLQHHLPLKCSK